MSTLLFVHTYSDHVLQFYTLHNQTQLMFKKHANHNTQEEEKMMIYSPTHDSGCAELQWMTEFGRLEDVHKIQAHKGHTGQADVVMRGKG